MIIELENTLVRREKKSLKSVYRLANEGRPLREVFQPLVVLRRRWRGRQRAPVVRQWKYRQRKKVDARRKRGLRLRTRKRGRRRRERRGFGNEYRGIDDLREIRRSARRFR